MNGLWLLLSLAGVMIVLLAVFWKREGNALERIVDALFAWDDPKDRSPRAWLLVIGAAMSVLGMYLAIKGLLS